MSSSNYDSESLLRPGFNVMKTNFGGPAGHTKPKEKPTKHSAQMLTKLSKDAKPEFTTKLDPITKAAVTMTDAEIKAGKINQRKRLHRLRRNGLRAADAKRIEPAGPLTHVINEMTLNQIERVQDLTPEEEDDRIRKLETVLRQFDPAYPSGAKDNSFRHKNYQYRKTDTGSSSKLPQAPPTPPTTPPTTTTKPRELWELSDTEFHIGHGLTAAEVRTPARRAEALRRIRQSRQEKEERRARALAAAK